MSYRVLNLWVPKLQASKYRLLRSGKNKRIILYCIVNLFNMSDDFCYLRIILFHNFPSLHIHGNVIMP